MIVEKLIEELESLDSNLVLMANIDGNGGKLLFVYIFGNSQGFPIIKLSDIRPLPSAKKVRQLLNELERWVERGNKNASPIHLMTSFDYEDSSYDLKYYSIINVINSMDTVTLISDGNEILEMREHFN